MKNNINQYVRCDGVKGIQHAIGHRDASALARMANQEKPGQTTRRNPKMTKDDPLFPAYQAEINALFAGLMAIFPAAKQTSLKSVEEVRETKRQWLEALIENDITPQQFEAGKRMARQQQSDFWPSVGKFIGWCKTGAAEAAGLPTIEEVEKEFKRYANERWKHPSPEAFPWASPIMYWLVTDVRQQMREGNLSAGEVKKAIQKQLDLWGKKLSRGEQVPSPIAQIANQTREASQAEIIDPNGHYRSKGEEFLAKMRAKRLAKP